jgi:hypothetical protein
MVFSSAALAASKLGDLSEFRKTAVETEALVDKNQLVEAKAHVKKLEESWDEAEPSLKPRAATDWHKVDKSIDKALEALRASTPSKADCKQALVDLEKVIDQMAAH